MHYRQQTVRLASAAVAAVFLVRLLLAGFFHPIFQPEFLLGTLFYLETGQILRFRDPAPPEIPVPLPEESHPASVPPREEPEAPPVFGKEDLAQISMHYHGSYRPDLEKLIRLPLQWELADGQPAVLIVHAHGTEAYMDSQADANGSYRSRDKEKNMISIGDQVATVLENAGIRVIHDRTAYDDPDYSAAYSRVRAAVKQHLQEHPTIKVVLDLHRDAAQTPTGQFATAATVGGQKSAQLMMVVGTNESGNHHPEWEKNLAFALKLTAQLERTNPGITRPIDLRVTRFNMDLSPGSLLVEIGAAGNSRQEAIIAAHALAQSLISLSAGSAG